MKNSANGQVHVEIGVSSLLEKRPNFRTKGPTGKYSNFKISFLRAFSKKKFSEKFELENWLSLKLDWQLLFSIGVQYLRRVKIQISSYGF